MLYVFCVCVVCCVRVCSMLMFDVRVRCSTAVAVALRCDVCLVFYFHVGELVLWPWAFAQ